MEGFERPKTAQEAVLREIRVRLLDGRIQPGEAIRPDVFGAELGVSAVPVREALRILEGEGQVGYRPHRGYLVNKLEIDDLKEIHRVRELLEEEAVRCAMPRITPEHIARMGELLREMAPVQDDVVAIKAANRRFHFTLMEAAGMPHLIRLISWLWDASEPYCSLYFMRPENQAEVDAEHQGIMTAIESGDVEATIEQLNIHRRHALKVLERGLAAGAS
ncbi:MAG: GntR family transcriptional regulator [Gammaproteobacteria bacterium]|nr:GntR family transcriptional regulator [Gammaproteobacteria bacterium]NNM01925.1 GntR family transcriptional regulator [Gammaproteobacteria bacterium]